MDRLPREILAEVLEFLAGPAPSDCRLHEQPSDDLLKSETLDLKSASQVDKLWRGHALPILFRHVQWRPQLSPCFNTLDPGPLLQFLLGNRLHRHVLTFTLLIDFHSQETDATSVAYQFCPSDLEVLWNRVFAVIDPLRFTIIAPPTTLAALLNRMLFLQDAWSFKIPYHILSLARSHRAPRKDPEMTLEMLTKAYGMGTLSQGRCSAAACVFKGALPAPPCPLLTLRPWTSMLLNEGSSIPVYQTYEFFLRSPPSALSALLGTGEYPNDAPLFPATVVDFNYIAIFPLSSHVSHLVHALPRVDRLFVRFTPRPRNRILEDRQTLKHVDPADLWMERSTAFRHLIGEMVNPSRSTSNWKALKVFEISELGEEREVWNLASECLQRDGTPDGSWVLEEEGLLVRLDDDGRSPKGPLLRSSGSIPHPSPVLDDLMHGARFALVPNHHFQPVW
ncbi:F-box domain-containing protein [Apiospora marii]|uniref:F-box domain-containing protein n=1 Tax=Apiospora marii TaxID=335849 RepID=A0ABR1STV2_9PEZI